MPILTARQVADRIQQQFGGAWDRSLGDGLQVGSPDIPVSGIAVAWTPTFAVLRQAVASGCNLIVSRECAFWTREADVPGYSGAGVTAMRADLARDQTFVAKRDFIAHAGLAVYRLSGHWDAASGDRQRRALVDALGWDGLETPAGLFTPLTPTLGTLASDIRKTLDVRAMRVVGDPAARIRTVAVTHGFLLVPHVKQITKTPGVDVIVAGEPVEWEALPYLEDLITANMAKGLIVLGHYMSEEPGVRQMAQWLQTVVADVRVQALPAGEPFWSVEAQ